MRFSNNDVQHIFFVPFECLNASLEKCLFRSSAYILTGLFVFLILSCMSCLYILETNPLPVPLFANIFSHSMVYLFFFFMVSFAVQKLKAFFFLYCRSKLS